jgi:hypothetical protein
MPGGYSDNNMILYIQNILLSIGPFLRTLVRKERTVLVLIVLNTRSTPFREVYEMLIARDMKLPTEAGR